MNFKKIKEKIKKSWNWVWHSESIWSWLVALILIYIIVKFIFFPVLSLIMGTSLPLAGVESSSMDHQIVQDNFRRLSLCGNVYSKDDVEHINFNEYWTICGEWYEEINISREESESEKSLFFSVFFNILSFFLLVVVFKGSDLAVFRGSFNFVFCVSNLAEFLPLILGVDFHRAGFRFRTQTAAFLLFSTLIAILRPFNFLIP